MWRPLKGEPAGRRPQGSADIGIMEKKMETTTL